MGTRQFRAGVERLEAREVLSTAAAVAVFPFGHLQVHGTGIVVSQTAIPNGSFETVTNLQGGSRSNVTLTGRLVVDFAPDQFHVLGGNAVFTDLAGDQIQANVTGGAFQVPVHGVSHVNGALRLAFIPGSGTGALANVTGTGHINLSVNVLNGNVRFKFGGNFVGA
jgi:hypothetical protein